MELALVLAILGAEAPQQREGPPGSASARKHQSGAAYPSSRQERFVQALSKQLAPYQHFPLRWALGLII